MTHVLGFMVGFYILARSVEIFQRNTSAPVRVFAAISAVVAILGLTILTAMAVMGPPEPNSQIFFSR